MISPSSLSSFAFNATYINALRQGDPSTENHFVSYFGPILLGRLRKKLYSTDQAWDLHQETFLRVLTILRSEKSVRDPERFEFFVLGICNNLVYETYRLKKRMTQLPTGFDMVSKALSPDACAMSNETTDYVRRLLSQLDSNAQAILQAVFLEEQDRDDICSRFNISRNYLRLLIFRAKKMLGACAYKEMTGKTMPRVQRARRIRRSLVASQPKPVLTMNKEQMPAQVFLPALPNDMASGPQWAQSCSA